MSEQKISVTAHTRTAAVLANWVLASRDATSAAYWAERSAAVEASQQHFVGCGFVGVGGWHCHDVGACVRLLGTRREPHLAVVTDVLSYWCRKARLQSMRIAQNPNSSSRLPCLKPRSLSASSCMYWQALWRCICDFARAVIT